MSYHDIAEIKRPVVCVSGGFDPLHHGHIRMFQEAAKHGSLIVILNSDDWLIRKKKYNFMDWLSRCEIIKGVAGVQAVSPVEDNDGTVCEALRRIKPDFFANGGDRVEGNTPEKATCEALGIKMLWNIGGEKIASSSEYVRKLNDHTQDDYLRGHNHD